jgi:hypothetical protein
MASIRDVYGNDFADEMDNKKYNYLEEKPTQQILTQEEIENNKKRAEKLREDIISAFTKTITIGSFIINTLCYESYPCQHYCNKKLMYAPNILELLNESHIDLDNLNEEQTKFIKHLKY